LLSPWSLYISQAAHESLSPLPLMGEGWDFTPESLSRCYMHLVANVETPEGAPAGCALDERLGEKPSAPSSITRRYRRIGALGRPWKHSPEQRFQRLARRFPSFPSARDLPSSAKGSRGLLDRWIVQSQTRSRFSLPPRADLGAGVVHQNRLKRPVIRAFYRRRHAASGVASGDNERGDSVFQGFAAIQNL